MPTKTEHLLRCGALRPGASALTPGVIRACLARAARSLDGHTAGVIR